MSDGIIAKKLLLDRIKKAGALGLNFGSIADLATEHYAFLDELPDPSKWRIREIDLS